MASKAKEAIGTVEMRAEIKAIDAKVEHIDKKLDIDRRMTIMEAKMKELEKRS